MAQYDLTFAERLVQVATQLVADDISSLDAQRTVLYLSLLSMEISLKAMLEQAGKPVAHTHDLAYLLKELDRCKVEVEVTPGLRKSVSASRIRSTTLSHQGAEVTVGSLIDAQTPQVSKYPNEVRYGDVLRHFPVEVVAQAATAVTTFARQHFSTIRQA